MSSQAGAAVIDFESLAHADALIGCYGTSYSEDGFTLSTPSGPFCSYGTLNFRFSGSTALGNDALDGVTELALTGGGSFSVVSIDLSELNESLAFSVTFIGDLTGGGTVSNTFMLDGSAFGAETFIFTGFGKHG